MKFLNHLYRTILSLQPFGPEPRFVHFAAAGTAPAESEQPEEEETAAGEKKKEKEKEKAEEEQKAKKPKRIDEESQEEAVFKRTRKTTQRIRETLAATGVGLESMRQTKERGKFQHAYNTIQKISSEDTKNSAAIDTLLKGFIGKVPLSALEAVRDLDWNRKADLPKVLDNLKKYGVGQYEREQLRSLKQREWSIEEKFTKASLEIQHAIGKVWEKVDQEETRQHMMGLATRATGINVREGTKLRWKSKGEVRGGKRMSDAESADISRIELVMGMNKDTNHTSPAFIVIHLSNGDRYTLGRFMHFVDDHEVEEVCENKEQCESAAGWSALGRTIEPGTAVAYFSYTRDKNGNLVRKKENVTIESMNGGMVRLDKPVLFLRKEANPALLLEDNVMKQEFTLGEFAKWMRRNEAMPNITTAEDAQQMLGAIADYRNRQLSRDTGLYPPIELKAGSRIQFGSDPDNIVKIDRVIGDRVQISNGEKMTLPAFLAWVLENGAENGNPDVQKGRIQKALSKIGQALPPSEEKPEESVPPSEKPEEPEPPSRIAIREDGYFTDLWRQTNMMSMADVFNFGKEIIEYIKRRHQRNSKGRYSTVGQGLPGKLGYEFKRVSEEAQEEEVRKNMEPMKNLGVWEIEKMLHTTTDRDQAKAALNVLAEKGHIRWDNRHLHKNLNRLVRWYTHRKDIYIPENDAEEEESIRKYNLGSQDVIQIALDALWGEESYAHWFNQNNSQYDSKIKEYAIKGQQLEGDPLGTGGLSGRMRQLLMLHRQGYFVDPQEYEGLIRYSVDAGKMAAEDKLYYLVAGVSVENPKNGETILSLDRFGVMDGNFLNRFPMLDMIVDKGTTHLTCSDILPPDRVVRDKDGKPIEGKRYRVEDFRRFMQEFEKDEMQKGLGEDDPRRRNAPGKLVTEFMWQRVLPHQKTHVRNTKGIRNAHMIDHDDAHIIITQASEQEVDNLTTTMGGAQSQFTLEGFANSYPGWNQGFKSLMESKAFLDEDTRLFYTIKMLRNFIRLNGILTGRMYAAESRRSRLDRSHFMKKSVVDPTDVWVHRKALEDMAGAIGDAYGIRSAKGQRLADVLFPNKTGIARQEGADKEDEKFLKNVGELLEDAVRQDGGQKLFAVIRQFMASGSLQGMAGPEYATSYEALKQKQKAQQSAPPEASPQTANMNMMELEEEMGDVPEGHF